MTTQPDRERTRFISIEQSLAATEEPRSWRLLDQDGVDYYARMVSEWTWEFYPSANADERHTLRFVSGPIQMEGWIGERELLARAHELYQTGQDWLRLYLPWLPLLIVAATRPLGNPVEACRRRALLAMVAAEVIYLYEDPDLDATKRHLARLAYTSVADYYEMETALSTPQRRMRASVGRWLHRWLSILALKESSGFFAEGMPQASERAAASGCEPSKVLVYTFTPERDPLVAQESAMHDVLFVAERQPETSEVVPGRERLRRYFREDAEGRRRARELVRSWYLPRYDLDEAEKIKQTLHSAEDNPTDGGYLHGWSGRARLSRWAHRGLLGLGFFYLLLFLFPPLAAWPTAWLIGGAYVLGVLQAPHWILSGQPDTSLPRLRAGMLLAVVGTLLQQNWDNLLDFSYRHAVPMLVIALILVVVSFQVLFTKVANTLHWEGSRFFGAGRSLRREAMRLWRSLPWRRSFFVLRRELSISFLLSIALMDLMGGSYIEAKKIGELQGLSMVWPTFSAAGVLSHTYPALVLFFSAILLFAGIFSQILWDEKPMTGALT